MKNHSLTLYNITDIFSDDDFEVTDIKIYLNNCNICFQYLERPVHAKEPVLQLAMSMGGKSDLVVKENYIAEKIAPFVSRSCQLLKGWFCTLAIKCRYACYSQNYILILLAYLVKLRH